MGNHTYHRIDADTRSVEVNGVVIGYVIRSIHSTGLDGNLAGHKWRFKTSKSEEWRGSYETRREAREALQAATASMASAKP